MKFWLKLAIYNSFTKFLIIIIFVAGLPKLIDQIAIIHTDIRLDHQKEKVMNVVDKIGIGNYLKEEQDSSYASYNILKEEYILLQLSPIDTPDSLSYTNQYREIEGEDVEYRVMSFTFKRGDKSYLLEIGRSLLLMSDLKTSLIQIALIVFFFVIIITVIVDLSTARQLLHPFTRIIRKIKRSNHPDNFDFEPVKTSTKDFRYLDESLNLMMAQIKDAFVKEKNFISHVSHELLTPISVVKSKIENVLVQESLSDENYLKLESTLYALSRLSKLTNNLLLISKIENQQFYKCDNVEVKNIIDEVLDMLKEKAELKNVSINVLNIELFTINNCNESLLTTLLVNVVDNAIKYNKDGGYINIQGQMVWGIYNLKIEDSGCGIEEDSIEKLFDIQKKFTYQSTESNGMGLSIVKAIADFHNFKIMVESKKNEGTRFLIKF